MDATLIYNPLSGQREVRAHLRNVVGFLAERGWRVEWKETSEAIDAATLAHNAATQGAEVVIAAGGDGTINSVVNGLVGHPGVRLGILPTGTANVWARETGISNISLLGPNLSAAGEVLVNGVTVPIDVGKAAERYFLLVAGVGFDATVVSHIDPTLKRHTGALAYAWAAFREGLRYRGRRVRITVDGQTIERTTWLVTISNARLYALVPLAVNASVTDGLLDIGIFTGLRWPQFLRHTLAVILGSHTRDPEIEFLRGKEIHLEASPPLPFQVDAEPVGYTPVTFTVLPRALQVIVPRQVAASLLEHPGTSIPGEQSVEERNV